jgi:hypothetical protein
LGILRWAQAATLIGFVICTGILGPRLATADDNRWGFGSDLGFTSGTVDDTVFTLGFNLDYYLDRNFSIGPMMQLSPMGDLFQIAFAGVGRYHLRFTNGINLVPFLGFGMIHADLDRGSGPGSINRNDTSWYVPVGLSLEYQVVHNIAVTSTLQVNLYNIDLSPSLAENDHNSVTLLFGFRWGP